MRSETQEITHMLDQRPMPALATRWWSRFGILCLQLFLFWAATAIVSTANDEQAPARSIIFTNLFNFDGADGDNPYMNLVQGTDGNLYGTTSGGGAYGPGEVFRMTPTGTLTVLYNFCVQTNCTDGGTPNGLLLATDGNFYGTSQSGGTGTGSTSTPCPFGFGGCGTVFKVTAEGTLTTLYSFCSQMNCTDGAVPATALIQASDGDFYGTTLEGGSSASTAACTAYFGSPLTCGTVFRVTPGGTLTTTYSFCSQTNCTDGFFPMTALIQATDGNFYGATQGGGANGSGTFFRITPRGSLTTLYSFCAQANCTDGSVPIGGLVQATDGNLYGTTYFGGDTSCGGGYGCGTVFKSTPEGSLTTLVSFDVPGPSGPQGGFVQASDGNFYGTTFYGGPFKCGGGCGTVFELTPEGKLTTLHNFDVTDGFGANGLTQATNGTFYGSTLVGGNGIGNLFSLSVGLGRFVETVPTAGRVGESVKILGTDLLDATSVSFNGTPATFNVASHSLILATVPDGATSGYVSVATRSGTLKSNARFQVRP